MGVAGTDAAIEAAHVALMRDDWRAVPEAIRIGRRAFRTIKQNLWFTAAYNVVGIALAATGWLPPIGAAAAQSLPDVVPGVAGLRDVVGDALCRKLPVHHERELEVADMRHRHEILERVVAHRGAVRMRKRDHRRERR